LTVPTGLNSPVSLESKDGTKSAQYACLRLPRTNWLKS